MKRLFLLATLFIFCLKVVFAQPGRPDYSFGRKGIVHTDFGATGNIYGAFGKQILARPDGTNYLTFETNEQVSVTHLLADGSIDISYGIHGYAHVISGYAVLQKDNKLVVAGAGIIARYNADGSIDKTFGENGMKSSAIKDINAAAVENNGKIVVVGSSGLARYNADGSSDNTFNRDFFPGDNPSIAVQNDGKIIVYSTYRLEQGLLAEDGDYRTYAILTRLNVNGSVDSAFGKNGRSDSTGSYSIANAVAVQKDGKIVVVDDNTPAVARYDSNGSFDSTFSGDGIAGIDVYIDYNSHSLAVQPDGKILVAGAVSTNKGEDFALLRYNTSGTPDTTFSKDGKKYTHFSLFNFPTGIAVQNDGKIVVAGSVAGADNHSSFAVARYTNDGSLDSAFSKDGKIADYVRAGNTIFNSTAVQPDGKIVVAGVADAGNGKDFAVARYNTDGSLDSAFSVDGKQTTDFGYDDEAHSVAIQKDGKIVVAGGSKNTGVFPPDTKLVMSRYNTDGTLDTTFADKGKLKSYFENQDIAKSIVLQSDGKIVAALASDNYFSSGFIVARYNANGTPDSTFSEDGITQTKLGNTYQGAESVVVQKNGKIVVAGSGGNYLHYDFTIVRYNADGTTDNTFGDHGILINDLAYTFNKAQSAVVQNDGKVVVAGTVSNDTKSYFVVARYKANGTPDNTFFNNSGVHIFDNTAGSDIATSATLQKDGKIIIAGSSNGNFALARLNANGSTDSSFGKSGMLVTNTGRGTDIINGLIISQDKLYVAGAGKYPANIGVVARYLLSDNGNTSPTVSITAPTNNSTYLAPAAHIKLSATAADSDGTITKVELYKDSTLLHTETVIPYGYVWRNVALGNYTLTAKAYDNSGNVTTSAPVHISVVPNKPPVVNMIAPVNNQNFTAPASIHLQAAASDTDGRITNVKFYNGTALLNIQYQLPYTYHWTNVAAGIYTITVVATDNWGAQTTSAPVTVTVTNASIVGSKPYLENGKTTLNDALTLKLSPNPANKIINIYTSGLQQNKPATISIISVSGIVLKTIDIKGSMQTIPVDVSSLASGVYAVKVLSANKVMYKQFVKR